MSALEQMLAEIGHERDALRAENERLKQQWGESDKAWLAARARVAELERAVMRARLELLEGECEPADNAVEILSAALETFDRGQTQGRVWRDNSR